MLSLKQRLLAVEQECFNALAEGGDTLNSFNAHWEALVADVDTACDSNLLDGDLMTLVHAVSSRVAILVDTSVELFTTCDSLSTDFVGQMEVLLAELAIQESAVPLSPPPSPQATTSPKRRRSSDEQRDVETTKYRKRKRLASGSLSPSPSPPTSVSSSVVFSLSPSPSNPKTTPHTRRRIPLTAAESPSATTSRKRRRSDADGDMARCTKRHHVGPRLHAVSDSFVLRQPPREELLSPSLQATNGVRPIFASLSTSSTEALVPGLSLLPDVNAHGTITSSDGFDICSIWDKPHDPLSSLSDLPELDAFLQTFLDADHATVSLSIPSIPFDDMGFSLDKSADLPADQSASSPASTSTSSSPSSPPTPISPSSPSTPILHVLSPPQYQLRLPLGSFDRGESFSSLFPAFQSEGKMDTAQSCGYGDILSTSVGLAQLPLSRSWLFPPDILDTLPSVDAPPPPYSASATHASWPDCERSLPALSLKTLASDWLEPVVPEGFMTKDLISGETVLPLQVC